MLYIISLPTNVLIMKPMVLALTVYNGFAVATIVARSDFLPSVLHAAYGFDVKQIGWHISVDPWDLRSPIQSTRFTGLRAVQKEAIQAWIYAIGFGWKPPSDRFLLIGKHNCALHQLWQVGRLHLCVGTDIISHDICVGVTDDLRM